MLFSCLRTIRGSGTVSGQTKLKRVYRIRQFKYFYSFDGDVNRVSFQQLLCSCSCIISTEVLINQLDAWVMIHNRLRLRVAIYVQLCSFSETWRWILKVYYRKKMKIQDVFRSGTSAAHKNSVSKHNLNQSCSGWVLTFLTQSSCF